MENAGFIFLALFALTLFGMYIAIRRAWWPVMYIGGSGALLNFLFVMLYALAYEKTSRGQALFAGGIVGLGFSGIVVIVANFFRANQPPADIRFVTRPTQEKTTDGRRTDHSQTPE